VFALIAISIFVGISQSVQTHPITSQFYVDTSVQFVNIIIVRCLYRDIIIIKYIMQTANHLVPYIMQISTYLVMQIATIDSKSSSSIHYADINLTSYADSNYR
jgi:hypothetical protein